YPRLLAVANRWAAALGADPYPPTLRAYLARCAARGQRRPTPLLLRYAAGGFNCLHQDLYGPLVFPFQVTCVLSQVGADYTGGEFLLVEQRPRSQSRGEAIVLQRGEAIVFATRHRPVPGARGFYRVTMRHGVSRLHSGERVSLGIIFHGAARGRPGTTPLEGDLARRRRTAAGTRGRYVDGVAGTMRARRRSLPRRSYTTVPSTSAKSVKSRPMPTFGPG